jgi:hypothetical protein
MTHPGHCIRNSLLKRADIHVGLKRRGGGGGTSGPSFPRPRSPHSLLPLYGAFHQRSVTILQGGMMDCQVES